MARLGGAGGEPHRVAELAVAHDFAKKRWGASQLTTQLANDPRSALVDVDALSHEGGPLAIHATVAIGGEVADAALQQKALQLLHIAWGSGHVGRFAVSSTPPPGVDLH